MTRRLTILMMVLALLAAACGQKSGVAGQAATGGGEVTSDGTDPDKPAAAAHEPGPDDKSGVTDDET